MTARRAARAARISAVPAEDGLPPRELLDAEALAWRDWDAFLAFMRAHDLDRDGMSPLRELLGPQTHPANRRNWAAESWACANGLGLNGRADWGQLRRMGLIA